MNTQIPTIACMTPAADVTAVVAALPPREVLPTSSASMDDWLRRGVYITPAR
jgi:hypothetical protein